MAYDALVEKYNVLKEEYDTLQQEIESRQSRRLRMEAFIHSLEGLDKVPLEFDEDRWCCLVDKGELRYDSGFSFLWHRNITCRISILRIGI